MLGAVIGTWEKTINKLGCWKASMMGHRHAPGKGLFLSTVPLLQCPYWVQLTSAHMKQHVCKLREKVLTPST